MENTNKVENSQRKELNISIKERIQELEQKLKQIDTFRVYKCIDYGLREYTETKEKLKDLNFKLKKLQSQQPKELKECFFNLKYFDK